MVYTAGTDVLRGCCTMTFAVSDKKGQRWLTGIAATWLPAEKSGCNSTCMVPVDAPVTWAGEDKDVGCVRFLRNLPLAQTAPSEEPFSRPPPVRS